MSGHPSTTGRAQDRESSPAKDRRSTTVPRNQPTLNMVYIHGLKKLVAVVDTVCGQLPITRAKSLSSAVSHNSANVAVSSEQSPERLHQCMNTSILFRVHE